MIQEEGFLLLLLLGQLLLLRRRRRRGAAMAGVGATHATPGVYVAELMIPVASAGRQRHASSRALLLLAARCGRAAQPYIRRSLRGGGGGAAAAAAPPRARRARARAPPTANLYAGTCILVPAFWYS
jgi:hypothetical protein